MLYIFVLGPIRPSENGFANFFVFLEFIRSRVSEVNEYTDTHIFLRYVCFHIFFLIVIVFVNTPKYLFSLDYSFQICENPSKFFESVCSHIRVRIVVDYANSVSA